MFLTTRGRYATRAMIHLATKYGGAPVPVAEVARVEQISEKYLQQLLGTLRRSGLVRVVMGPHGGFALARDPGQITIGEVVRCVEGDIALVECVVNAGLCERAKDCPSRKVWESASRKLNEFLDSQSLAASVRGLSSAQKPRVRRKKASKALKTLPCS
jgi:Rrf2 family transcriptional regulator, cysteine metabolism repressor